MALEKITDTLTKTFKIHINKKIEEIKLINIYKKDKLIKIKSIFKKFYDNS